LQGRSLAWLHYSLVSRVRGEVAKREQKIRRKEQYPLFSPSTLGARGEGSLARTFRLHLVGTRAISNSFLGVWFLNSVLACG
jgi:hypothetical protein